VSSVVRHGEQYPIHGGRAGVLPQLANDALGLGDAG
jgi:hypothetical protein